MAPELAFYRDGQVESVKYDRISVVLVNAVKNSRRRLKATGQATTGAKLSVRKIRQDSSGRRLQRNSNSNSSTL
jgi:type III secretory pathway lipoprotein EscJ